MARLRDGRFGGAVNRVENSPPREEGWPRQRPGWSLTSQISVCATTPSAALRWASPKCLDAAATPPHEEGNAADFQLVHISAELTQFVTPPLDQPSSLVAPEDSWPVPRL